MKSELSISPSLADAHRAAIDDANRWRGHCVEKFSRLEVSLRATVAAMSAHPDGAANPVPHLFGQYLKSVATAVADDGWLAQTGASVRLALDRFESFRRWRNIVIHSVSDIYIDRQGRWLWQYEFQPTDTGKHAERGSLTAAEAEELERELSRSIQSLNAHLLALIEALEAKPSPRT